jgi:hypothetical protein
MQDLLVLAELLLKLAEVGRGGHRRLLAAGRKANGAQECERQGDGFLHHFRVTLFTLYKRWPAEEVDSNYGMFI